MTKRWHTQAAAEVAQAKHSGLQAGQNTPLNVNPLTNPKWAKNPYLSDRGDWAATLAQSWYSGFEQGRENRRIELTAIAGSELKLSQACELRNCELRNHVIKKEPVNEPVRKEWT